MCGVNAPVPGPSSTTQSAWARSPLATIARANQRELGAIAPTLVGRVRNCRRNPPPPALELAAEPDSPARFGAVPDFELVDSRGESVARRDLAGAPWIAACFFTACQGPCPRLNADIRRLLVEPLGEEPIRVVSISVDPEYDTPERLAAYAEGFGADPERWLFLTGDAAAITTLVRDGFRLSIARRDADASPEAAAEPITHSDRFVLVDQALRIRGYYHGTIADDVASLETDLVRLANAS